MYKNIIFDLGNVLLTFDPEEYLNKIIDDKNKISIIYNAIFKSDEWPMLDRGTLTQEEAKRNIMSRYKDYAKSIELAFDNWIKSILTPIEDTVKILTELKEKGYKIYYLSNFHELAFDYVTSEFSFFKLFDGGIVSYKENLLKPEKEIYNRILDEYKLSAKESIFIDDMLPNIEGAKLAGLSTILFKSPSDLSEKLGNMLDNM
ncbi:MAG: HAD family phosphatase [Clostridium sp.]|nr:HAD family phosphatase [Clostridium sp.]